MQATEAPYRQRVTFRWADIDANFHVRHSVYYDLGSQQRIHALSANGLTMRHMQQGSFGPVIFREECRFLKEIKPEDEVDIVVGVKGLSKDYRKFIFQHAFMRGEELCAMVQVEGAWFNSTQRKIDVPPQLVVDAVNDFPKADDFAWMEQGVR
ncbi:MAG: thioesterase family protein [Flavobacteriales bacterium]|jgi:acyl-CoA thioester hydrolase|nr:thioesterase family protein [Flavobacteriales bacterium]